MKKNKRTTKTFILAGTLAGAVVMTTTLPDSFVCTAKYVFCYGTGTDSADR